MNIKDLKIDFYKSGGPGGQHKNKRNMAVRVTHLPTGLTAVCQEYRYQGINKDVALERIQVKLAQKMAKKKKRIPTRISKGAKERVLSWKKGRSSKKAVRREKFLESD